MSCTELSQAHRMQGACVCLPPASPQQPGWSDAERIAGPGSQETRDSTVRGELGSAHATLV
jgi:hypothetical protein